MKGMKGRGKIIVHSKMRLSLILREKKMVSGLHFCSLCSRLLWEIIITDEIWFGLDLDIDPSSKIKLQIV